MNFALVHSGPPPVFSRIREAPYRRLDRAGEFATFTQTSGSGASLLHTATRPAIPEGTPVYQFAYDAKGKLTDATGPTGIVTHNTYDGAESLTSTVVDPGTGSHLHLTTGFTYDPLSGNVTSTTDPRGNVTTSLYDANRRKTEDDHHDGNAGANLNAASKTVYDVLGRVTDEQAGTAFSGTTVTSWLTTKHTTYTPTSKVFTVTDADNRTTSTTYDAGDRVLTVADPIGRKLHYRYCAPGDANCAANAVRAEYRGWQSGNSCSQPPPSLQQCYRRVTYSLNGQQKTLKDANGNTTTYATDGFDRLVKTTFPDNTFEQLTLDEDANVTARRNRAGQTLTYAYDDLDQLREKVSPSPAVTTDWTYLLDGRIDTLCTTAICGAAGDVIDYNYDSAARLKQVRTKIPGLTIKVTNYELDANGNRTKLTWPDNYAVSYCYDSLNRMTAAWDNAACTDPDPNKRLALYSYDPLSRRTNLAYAGTGGASMTYTYSNAGDLLTLKHITAGGPQYTLTYTPAHQLETEALNNANFVWQPPATGSTSYGAANTLNQYPTVGGVAQTYDSNGNLTGDGTTTFTYDAENRLLTASKTGLAATYQYDPLGRRTRKSGTGVTDTIYLSDGTDEIAEYAAGALTTRYIPGPAIDQTIAMVDAAGAKSFFHTNKQGSLVAATDATNTRTEGPYTYDPYGNCFRSALSCSTLTPSTIPFKYTGRRLDPETGLYYYRARYYCPKDSCGGRFLQTDPVGYDAGLNLYAYVGNDPMDMTDPGGEDRVCVIATGTIIPSCVDVNGGKDTNTLTADQKATIAQDFKGFIVHHNNKNITSSGARVTGGDTADQNFISAVSQFVGALTGGWKGVDIDIESSKGMEWQFALPGTTGNRVFTSDDAAHSGLIGHEKLTAVNKDHRKTFSRAGNAARTLMHERVHWLWGGDTSAALPSYYTGAHQALDAEALSRMKAGGLGGCESEGTWYSPLPGCQ